MAVRPACYHVRTAGSSLSTRPPYRCSLRLPNAAWNSRRSPHRSAAFKTAAGKLISKTEIPGFIPRSDLMDQLLRWAYVEAQQDSLATFGLPMKVAAVNRNGVLWGVRVTIARDGEDLTNIAFRYDEETVQTSEWVGRGADGFPVAEGKSMVVEGKNLEIWKEDDYPVDEQLREVIRTLCKMFVAALNKYYAFGSCFVDDTT